MQQNLERSATQFFAYFFLSSLANDGQVEKINKIERERKGILNN